MTKKKYKLLLINPLSTKRIGLIRDPKSIYPPMSLGIIAALTPDDWDIDKWVPAVESENNLDGDQ